MPTIDLEAIRHRVMDSPWWSGNHREIDYRVMHDARALIDEVDRLRAQGRLIAERLPNPAWEALDNIDRHLNEWASDHSHAGYMGTQSLLTLCQTRLVLVQSIMAQMG